jgi:hypothetical protein
MREAGMQEV